MQEMYILTVNKFNIHAEDYDELSVLLFQNMQAYT